MSTLLFLDFLWKFLFFMTVLSLFYFLIISVSAKVFKFYSASKKMQAIKASILFVMMALLGAGAYLFLSDGDLIADCFGRFADKEGVFGITRIMSAVWLSGFTLLISKDILNYRRKLQALENSVIKAHTFQNINYFEVDDAVEPVMAGLWKPQIYIPTNICENPEALKQILSHEFIHFKNNDGLWSFLNLLIHRLNWHNPVTLFSMPKIKIQIEMATDEQAIKEFNLKVSDYAEQLVKLISVHKQDSLLMMNVSSDFVQMQLRLLNLKNIQNGKIRKNSWYLTSILFFLSFGVSEAYASIKQSSTVLYQGPVCCQAQNEMIIESLVAVKNKTESNKCE